MPAEKLVIDHKDNDPLNGDPDNLQLISQSENIKKNPSKLYNLNKKDVDFSHTLTPTTDPPLRPQSVEMAKNMKSEPLFINWLENKMRKYWRVELEQVINSGAQIAGVSTYTIRNNYLKKLTSEEGPYKITLEKSTGIKYLEWKERDFPFKKEIEKWTK